eukprot:scpid45499/ scgid13774/ 
MFRFTRATPLAAGHLLMIACASGLVQGSVPTVDDLAGDWVDLNQEPFQARDLPTINNFWGSAGVSPENTRPVDLFAINALELPPYAGCGASAATPYGCGQLLINGKHIPAEETMWSAYSAGRRTSKGGDVPAGLHIQTDTRMQFEANAVLWKIQLMNSMASAAVEPFQLSLHLNGMVRKLSTVGTWVFPTPNQFSQFNYTVLIRPGSRGVTAQDMAASTQTSKPAAAAFVCLGTSPDITAQAGTVPQANFKIPGIPVNTSIVVRVALVVADTTSDALTQLNSLDGSEAEFDSVFTAGADRWQDRWEAVFDSKQEQFSGNLPTLSISSERGADIERVYYTSILTVVTQARTNLPIVYKTVFVNGQGNLGWPDRGIGGATSWWWDESLTSMMLSLLEPAGRTPTLQAWLHSDPTATGSNHYAMDCSPPGTVSCKFPSHSEQPSHDKRTVMWRDGTESNEASPASPPTGFYCYNLWALFMTISNHLRVNNDEEFLKSKAGSTNMTVEEALANVATFWKQYVIEGTSLVDFAWRMDGFSGSYKHVMPGCSQGNNVWMMREMARLYDVQKRGIDAQSMRDYANRMSNDTIHYMYEKGGGYFNLVYPPEKSGGPLIAYEYRHLVDFFSVTFGLCGGGQSACDFDAYPGMRKEMADWFRDETVTCCWARATSPKTNCSRTWPLSSSSSWDTGNRAAATDADEWPGYKTCDAGRPDHGTTGSYPSWPAFALEALCYLEDYNCSSAAQIMASFVSNTHEGPFGQATYAPQQTTPPYAPQNDLPSYKPTQGVTRYLGIEGGSFFDAVLRGFFGYHPPMLWPGGERQDVLNAALAGKSKARGFTGTLTNLRTPFGLATISAGPTGLSI